MHMFLKRREIVEKKKNCFVVCFGRCLGEYLFEPPFRWLAVWLRRQLSVRTSRRGGRRLIVQVGQRVTRELGLIAETISAIVGSIARAPATATAAVRHRRVENDHVSRRAKRAGQVLGGRVRGGLGAQYELHVGHALGRVEHVAVVVDDELAVARAQDLHERVAVRLLRIEKELLEYESFDVLGAVFVVY